MKIYVRFSQFIQGGAEKLARFEFWLVAGMAGASVFWERLLPAVACVGLMVMAARWIARGRFPTLRRLDLPFLGLGLLLPLTLAVTALPERTLPQVCRLLTGILLAYSILHWANSRTRLAWLAGGFCALGLGLAAAAMFSVQWFTDKFRFIPLDFLKTLPSLGLDRVHPNVLAGALVLVFVFIACGTLFYWSTLPLRGRVGLGLLIGAMGLVLLFTQSRGALLAAAAAFALAILLKFRRGWLVVLALVLAGAGAALWLGPEKMAALILSSSGTGNSVGGRLEIWSRALAMIADFPITGIGMGSFAETADTLYPFTTFSPATVPHAHNLSLQIAVDLGLPGLAAWLAALGSISWYAWQVYRSGVKNNAIWLAALGAALLCAQVTLGVHGLLDAVTWGTRPAVVVWAVWGMAMAAWNVDSMDRNPHQADSTNPA